MLNISLLQYKFSTAQSDCVLYKFVLIYIITLRLAYILMLYKILNGLIESLVFYISNYFTSVSYTHLDVYKRQAMICFFLFIFIFFRNQVTSKISLTDADPGGKPVPSSLAKSVSSQSPHVSFKPKGGRVVEDEL